MGDDACLIDVRYDETLSVLTHPCRFDGFLAFYCISGHIKVTINLSESGRVLCTELKSRGSTAGHAAFDCLTPDEIRVFSATLDRIEESIGR